MNMTGVYGSLEESTLKRAAGGWLAESTGATAALVFAIAGLAGVRPSIMAGIATILIGISILIEGGTFASAYAGLVSTFRNEGRAVEWGGVITAEFLGGLAGIALGILALVGIAPLTSMSIAVLIFGATFLFSSMVSLESGFQALGGVVAFVLGLLAASEIIPITLILVALLVLAVVGLASGALTGRKVLQASHPEAVSSEAV